MAVRFINARFIETFYKSLTVNPSVDGVTVRFIGCPLYMEQLQLIFRTCKCLELTLQITDNYCGRGKDLDSKRDKYRMLYLPHLVF